MSRSSPAARAGPVSTRWELIKLLLIAAGLLLCIVLAASLSLANGIPKLSMAEAWGILWGEEAERLARLSVRELRAPRVALGILSGAALGLAGAMMQDGLRNPLAGPELLGVASGASLTVAVVTLFQVPLLLVFHPWVALTGGLLAGAVVIVAAKGARNTLQIVLIGVAVAAFINACIIALISLAGTSGSTLVLFYFLLGSLANRTWEHVWIVAPWVAICLPLGLLLARPLNTLRLGDHAAQSLGMSVGRVRTLVLLLGAGLVAAVVAVAGPIGWIGLLAPHLTRRALRSEDPRKVLAFSALMGTALLTMADVGAKLAIAPAETPVGLWTVVL
ncbi:MAG: iron ABC transporter permease, partial [Acidobacteria bacterium]|nr:iron ABC transporter permease [Acidobacteriota bacterium]